MRTGIKHLVTPAARAAFLIIAGAWCPYLPAVEIGDEQPAENDGLRQITLAERIEHEPILTGLVQARVDAETRLRGQAPIVVANVTFNEKGSALVLEIGRAYLPANYSIEFEERVQRICDELVSYIEPVSPIRHVEFLIEGKDIFEYFPDEIGPQELGKKEWGASLFKKNDAGKGRVLVAAGHGIYFNTVRNEWTAQRDADKVTGLTEDFVTPAFAGLLEKYLAERSGVEVFRARSVTLGRHQESGNAWSAMAARYNLQESLPGLSEVWNSPGSTDSNPGQIERDQDIRSRPLYANHVGVDALIHVHTNGDADRDVRGIRVYHFPGREDDKKFADLALCYMKESLSSNAFYANFPVSTVAQEGRHGENRLAAMPSIIAELGFHTNRDDGHAIESYVFRDLAMRGMEKAYRLFRQGHPCKSFTVDHPEVNVISDVPASIDVVFGGFPRFPVKYEMSVTECTPAIICTPNFGRFKDPDAPLTINYRCTATKDKPFTIKWNASFIDADGITAKTEVTMTCKAQS